MNQSECELCGELDPTPTTTCYECGGMKCETCDMGNDVVCVRCDLEGDCDEPEQPESDGLTEEEITKGYATVYDGFPFSQIVVTRQGKVREFANHFYSLGKQSAKAERDELKAEVEKLESMNMRIEERLTKKCDAMYQAKEIYRKENLDAIAILGSCLSIPTPETGDDVVSGDLVEIAKKAVFRLKSQPIEAKAGPPDLEGVPNDALFVCEVFGRGDLSPKVQRWYAGYLRNFPYMSRDIEWHIGPILPTKEPEPEPPKCPICGEQMEYSDYTNIEHRMAHAKHQLSCDGVNHEITVYGPTKAEAIEAARAK